MILTFNTLEELVNSFITKDGELNGYVPQYGLDATKLTYPVKIEVLDETGMFRLYEEQKITKAKKKLRCSTYLVFGNIFLFFFLIIFGIIILITGCSTKTKCIEYDGIYCKTEEVIYQRR